MRLDYGTYEYIVGEEINLISFFEKQEGDITSYLLDGVEVAGSTYKVEDKDVTIQVPFLNSYVVTFVGDGGATPVNISQLVETGDIIDLPSSFNFDVYKYVFLNYKIDDVLYEADKYTVTNKSVTIRAVTREKITSFYGSDFNTEIYETLEDALASGETKLYLGANYTITGNITIPSNITLSYFSEDYVSHISDKEYILKKQLSMICSDFDYIIIDTPPSKGLITQNALTAADSVIIPLQCEYFAMEAITTILALIRKIKTSTNPNLEIEGFLFTMFDANDQFQVEIANEIRNIFGTQVFSDYIPRNDSIPESQSKGIPIIMFRPNSIGAQAYLQVVKEIIQKNS